MYHFLFNSIIEFPYVNHTSLCTINLMKPINQSVSKHLSLSRAAWHTYIIKCITKSPALSKKHARTCAHTHTNLHTHTHTHTHPYTHNTDAHTSKRQLNAPVPAVRTTGRSRRGPAECSAPAARPCWTAAGGLFPSCTTLSLRPGSSGRSHTAGSTPASCHCSP